MLRDPEQVRHWAVLGQREYGGRGLGVAVAAASCSSSRMARADSLRSLHCRT